MYVVQPNDCNAEGPNHPWSLPCIVGRVFKAEEEGTGRLVAIKQVKLPQRYVLQGAVKSETREIQILRLLQGNYDGITMSSGNAATQVLHS